MSFVYFLSKFSQEAMLLELFLIGCLCTAYFGFLLAKKKRYGVAKNNIPDDVVRAFLIELIGQAEGFKGQLFGDSFKIQPGQGLKISLDASQQSAHAPAGPAVHAATPAPVIIQGPSAAELEAMKAQLAAAVAKQNEFSLNINKLNQEKVQLEGKLAAAAKAPAPAAGGGNDKALQDRIANLEAKLKEYEVIEDDLANLKKYQQENKQLKDQLAGMGGAPAVAAAPAPVAAAAPEPTPAPAPVEEPAHTGVLADVDPLAALTEAATPPAEAAPTPIAAAEESLVNDTANKGFEGLVDTIEQSLTPPAGPTGASVEDPLAQATPTPPPAAEPKAAAPAAAASGGDKSDADLLSEFERMLNS